MEKDVTYDTQDLENYFHFTAVLAVTHKNMKKLVDVPRLLGPLKVFSPTPKAQEGTIATHPAGIR